MYLPIYLFIYLNICLSISNSVCLSIFFYVNSIQFIFSFIKNRALCACVDVWAEEKSVQYFLKLCQTKKEDKLYFNKILFPKLYPNTRSTWESNLGSTLENSLGDWQASF